MKYVVKFVEFGYNFTSEPCSEEDADTLLARLKAKEIPSAYKTPEE